MSEIDFENLLPKIQSLMKIVENNLIKIKHLLSSHIDKSDQSRVDEMNALLVDNALYCMEIEKLFKECE